MITIITCLFPMEIHPCKQEVPSRLRNLLFLACFLDVDISGDEAFDGDILRFYCLVILLTILFFGGR